MTTWQKRVVDEHEDLLDKLRKLNNFILGKTFPTVAAAEQMRLTKQAEFMTSYADVLKKRIEAFE
jgi:hypothetical protein